MNTKCPKEPKENWSCRPQLLVFSPPIFHELERVAKAEHQWVNPMIPTGARV